MIRQIRPGTLALCIVLIGDQGAYSNEQGVQHSEWTTVQLRALKALEEDPQIPSRSIVAQALSIAREADSRRDFRVKSHALGTAVKRAEADGIGDILQAAEADAAIRISLSSWSEILYEKSGQNPRVIVLLGRCALVTDDPNGLYQAQVVQQISRLTNDPALLVRVLLPVVKLSPPQISSGMAARRIASLVTADHPEWNALRTIATQYLARQEYHPAIKILSYQGDIAILDGLEAVRDGATEMMPGPRSLFTIAIWQIQVQQPPENLLHELRTADGRRNRVFLMDRAVALGLSSSAIRSALMEYVGSPHQPDDIVWMSQRPRIVKRAQELGILSEDDIATIPPANRMPGILE